MVSAEQFVEWKEHPVTKEIFAGLKEVKESIVMQIANGNTIGPDAEATHGFTSRTVGQLDGLNQLLGISYEGIGVDEDDDTDGKSRY